MNVEKTYDVPSGSLKLVFYYNESICGELEPFDIISVSEFQNGYDDEDNIDVAIYPSNIEITLDDYISRNYEKLKLLLQEYTGTYPYNYLEIFTVKIIHNAEVKFVGILDEIESDNSNWSITLKFIDRINNLKNTNIANPHLLKKLKDNNIIQGKRALDSYAYGFRDFVYRIENGEHKGYVVNWLEYGDGECKLLDTLETLFKTIGDDIEIDFQNEFLFREPGAPYVGIQDLYIRRVLSNLFGRYVALKKAPPSNPVIYYLEDYPEYTKPEYFEKVFEDSEYVVFYHTWSGTLGSTLWHTGIGNVKVSEILKILAKNFFCYYGFKGSHSVYFRHKRFTSNPTTLTEIISMNKLINMDKVVGVKIEDQYENNVYTTYGKVFGATTDRLINYSIPLNSFLTDISYEYRLFYFISGVRKLVKYFKDKQQGYEGTAQEVIARAEFENWNNYRDKYEFELSGVNYPFDLTYRVDQYNYKGNFRPLQISIDYFENKTKMTAVEI
ncbi:MAG: hypothetical protein JNJ56_11325 [Ignavibacteria bacterium]|nr:hypothetical protein [Ignavibacteria bacterium]